MSRYRGNPFCPCTTSYTFALENFLSPPSLRLRLERTIGDEYNTSSRSVSGGGRASQGEQNEAQHRGEMASGAAGIYGAFDP